MVHGLPFTNKYAIETEKLFDISDLVQSLAHGF